MFYELVQENSTLITTISNTLPPKPAYETSHSAAQNKNLNIYVLSKEGLCLRPLEVQIEWKTSYQENCKQIIEAMKGIQSEAYISPIPEDLLPRGIFLTPEGELIIDLPAIIISKYGKNTTALFESLLTYSIVNSLLQKDLFMDINVKSVRFLIEGNVSSIEFPKHISWSQSFTPDYSFICSE